MVQLQSSCLSSFVSSSDCHITSTPEINYHNSSNYRQKTMSIPIIYTPGDIPTRAGLPLYDIPTHGKIKSNSVTTQDDANNGIDNADNTTPQIDLTVLGTQVHSFKNNINDALKYEPFKELFNNIIRLRHPTPAEEFYRGEQMTILRETCEKISMRILHRYLPKDLFDQCIFADTEMSKLLYDYLKILDVNPHLLIKNDHLSEWRDPIFPNYYPKLIEMIILRELFGDCVGRLISQDKKTSGKRVCQLISLVLEKSSKWYTIFLKFLNTLEGEDYIKKHPVPYHLLPKNDAWCVVRGHMHEWINEKEEIWEEIIPEDQINQESRLCPAYCPMLWKRWINKTNQLIQDYGLYILRFSDIFETQLGHHVSIGDTMVIQHCNNIIRDLLVALYPLIYPFVRQAANEIILAIELYREKMKLFCFTYKLDPSQVKPISVRSIISRSVKHKNKWDEEVLIVYDNDELRCRRAHFEKYIRLYVAVLSTSNRLLMNELFPVTTTHDINEDQQIVIWEQLGVPETEIQRLKERLYIMLKRYQSIIYSPSHYITGGNMHAAAPEKVFHFLKDSLGINVECFASPNNCFFSHYFSAFPDTDSPFGSLGNFFNITSLPSGSYEVGPPYTEELLLLTICHLETILQSVDNSYPLTFCLFVPDWNDCEGIQRMQNSKWCTVDLEGPGNQHVYVSGIQHHVGKTYSTRYYHPPHATKCFILQNELGREQYPITHHVKQLLCARMQDRCQSEQMVIDTIEPTRLKHKEDHFNTSYALTQDSSVILDDKDIIYKEDVKQFLWDIGTCGQLSIKKYMNLTLCQNNHWIVPLHHIKQPIRKRHICDTENSWRSSNASVITNTSNMGSTVDTIFDQQLPTTTRCLLKESVLKVPPCRQLKHTMIYPKELVNTMDSALIDNTNKTDLSPSLFSIELQEDTIHNRVTNGTPLNNENTDDLRIIDPHQLSHIPNIYPHQPNVIDTRRRHPVNNEFSNTLLLNINESSLETLNKERHIVISSRGGAPVNQIEKKKKSPCLSTVSNKHHIVHKQDNTLLNIESIPNTLVDKPFIEKSHSLMTVYTSQHNTVPKYKEKIGYSPSVSTHMTSCPENTTSIGASSLTKTFYNNPIYSKTVTKKDRRQYTSVPEGNWRKM